MGRVLDRVCCRICTSDDMNYLAQFAETDDEYIP
jgi:hypothetical protein